MATTSTFLPLHLQPPQSLHRRHHTCRLPPLTPSRNLSLRASSSPLPSSTLAVEEGDTSGAELSAGYEEGSQLRACKACGREEIERGCNGEGRIQGGIATVPGFGWWPIKAYRPCPGFVESGGRYRRQGQSMDEVAFGRGEREASLRSTDGGETRKTKAGSKSFKG